MSKVIFIFLTGLIMVMTAISVDRQGFATEAKEKLVRLGDGYALSDDEVKIMTDKALKGDPESAFRLSLYYEFAKRNHTESDFWLKISAENGHPVGQYNLGIGLLLDDPDPRNRQRARFWIERAAANGNSRAKERLKNLPK